MENRKKLTSLMPETRGTTSSVFSRRLVMEELRCTMERKNRQLSSVLFILSVILFISVGLGDAKDKYRVCVTEKPASKKYTKYCPLLEKPGSKATCVLGQSRLDCLRKILKGKADFGIFEAEDIVIAANYNNDESIPVLVTNELQYLKSPFDSEVLPVVRKSANITRISKLQGKKLCHTGYGYETDWTEVMSKFFEARVVPQMCDSDLSVVENRIKSSSKFFKAACKAGPWVPDRQMDIKLKQTYSNLCKLCDNPLECSTMDKYWGKVGPLYCLTDGAGDVAWARLAEVQVHFGLNTMAILQASPPADDYRFLCADNRLVPLDQPENCAWLARPWKAVLTKRDAAVHVQKMLTKLKDGERLSWEWALEELLEIHAQIVVPLDSMVPPEDYLQKAPGFLSANSLSHCEPNGKIRICTRSSIEMLKCDWLRRAADVYGIEPPLTCLKADSTEDCMKAVQGNNADVVTIQPDDMSVAYWNFGLKPVLYEYAKNLATVHQVGAIVKKESKLTHISDLKGKKACFPSYEGVGWNSIWSVLKNQSLVPSACTTSTEVLGDFFSDSCVPGVNKSHSFPASLQALCEDNLYDGELGALRCLATGKGDVAFIQLNTLGENTDGNGTEAWTADLKMKDFRSLCLSDQTEDCYLSWSAPGQVLISSNASALKEKDIYIALMELGNLFGKHHKAPTAEFQIFAPFDEQKNVLFQDVSFDFEDFATLKQGNSMVHNYETMFQSLSECSSARSWFISSVTFVISILVAYMISI